MRVPLDHSPCLPATNGLQRRCIHTSMRGVRRHRVTQRAWRGERFAKSIAGSSSVDSGGKKDETVRAAVEVNGKSVSRPLTNVSNAEDDSGHSAKGDLPEGTEFVMHGHVNKNMADKPGIGDSQVPLETNKPNVPVTSDRRIGVREIENGKLQHRMLRGQMSSTEVEKIRENMNKAAEIYNRRNK